AKGKQKYIPHLAAARFRPTMDWTKEEAEEAFRSRSYPFPVDRVEYISCIEGMKNLPDACVDMIIADPPFGINFNQLEVLYNRKSEHIVRGYQEVHASDYFEFTEKWISELPRLMKEHAGVWIFSGWTHLDSILNSLRKNKLTIINHIIWKYQFGAFTKRKFVSSHYHILFAVKNEKEYFFNKFEHYPLDVWDINRTYRRGKSKNATKLPVDV
ncbi:MAG: DNA-methyltransferase, partial [Candidatus Heimdallarchaeaceae archaeon]